MTAAVCRRPALLEDYVERNLVGTKGVSHSTVLNHLSSFRRLFAWRKKQAEFASELHQIQPAEFGTDIFSTIEELYVSCYINFVLTNNYNVM